MKDVSTQTLRAALARRNWVQTCLDALWARREARAERRAIDREVRELSKLEDHLLRDLGLSRDRLRTQVRDRRQAERRERFGW
jgi:uncharacterized protein YjiS (DUF1127 family)